MPAHPRFPIIDQSAAEDRLLAMIAALTSEVAVLRERLDTVERLAEFKGVLSRDEIEAYQPEARVSEERSGLRKRLIAKVFRPIRDDAERAAAAI